MPIASRQSRLRHDEDANSFDPELSGIVRWRTSSELASQFLKIFQNYQSAFPEASGEETCSAWLHRWVAEPSGIHRTDLVSSLMFGLMTATFVTELTEL